MLSPVYPLTGGKGAHGFRENTGRASECREQIEKANNNGDCIINVGDGYYRPDPNDIEDEVEFNEYMAKELHRARAIQKKRLSMKLTYERWREVGVLINYTGQTAEP